MTLSDALHAYGQLYQLAVPLLYMWAQPEIVHLLEEEKRVRNQVIVSGRAMDITFCTGHHIADKQTENQQAGNSREKFFKIIKKLRKYVF